MEQLGARVGLVLIGAFVSTVAYAATIRARLGLGPLFAVQEGLAKHTGLSIGRCVMVVGVVLVALAMAVRTPPGPGTLALPFLMGAILDLVLPHVGEINGLVFRLATVVTGTMIMCFGGALVIRAALGAAAIDGVMLGIHRQSGWNIRRVRLAMEITMIALGWLLGGAIGIGTVITGLMVGPALHFWLNLVDKKDAGEVHITV